MQGFVLAEQDCARGFGVDWSIGGDNSPETLAVINDLDTMLAALGRTRIRERSFETQAFRCPEYEDAARREPAPGVFLPPGAMYVLSDRPFRCPAQADAAIFSPDCKTLAAGFGGAVCLWSIPDGRLLHSFRLKGTLAVMRLEFGPGGQMVVLADAGGPARPAGDGLFGSSWTEQVKVPRVWLWQPGQAQAREPIEGTPLASFAISRDGKLLAAGEEGAPMIHLFNLDTGQPLGAITSPPAPLPTGLEGPDAFVALAFSGDGKNFVGARRGQLQVLMPRMEPSCGAANSGRIRRRCHTIFRSCRMESCWQKTVNFNRRSSASIPASRWGRRRKRKPDEPAPDGGLAAGDCFRDLLPALDSAIAQGQVSVPTVTGGRRFAISISPGAKFAALLPGVDNAGDKLPLRGRRGCGTQCMGPPATAL